LKFVKKLSSVAMFRGTPQELLETAVGEDDSLPSLCQRFSRLAQYCQSEEGAKEDPEAADTYKGKDLLLRSIGAYISRLQDFLFDLESAEDREHEASILAHNLPANVDKLVRYETMLERQKEKAINLLMKLQSKGWIAGTKPRSSLFSAWHAWNDDEYDNWMKS
jgi:hypothetical protein